MDDERAAQTAITMPKITLPDVPSVTPEELVRRRVLVAEARAIRDAIGPIGVRIDDIIHELRGGDERFDT